MEGYCERHQQPWDIKCVNGEWVCECPKCRAEGLLDTYYDCKTTIQIEKEWAVSNRTRAFIFGERLKDAPEIPQMTKEQMEECINETEKYIPKTDKYLYVIKYIHSFQRGNDPYGRYEERETSIRSICAGYSAKAS